MKKMLFISYHCPPRPGIGSQRPYGLAKYFPEYGWEPIILTAQLPGKPPNGIRVIQTDYKDVISSLKLKFGFNPEKGLHQQLGMDVSKDYNYPTLKSKIIKLVKEVVAFPDEQKGWYEYALDDARKILKKERIDVILSSSFPVTSHLIARRLKREYQIPWVADLRDLWTQNHYYNKFSLIRYFERRLEMKTLADADALVAVSAPLADKLKILHKDKKVFCVTNGYDKDDFSKPSQMTKKFTITYTGSIYNGKQDPSLLFEAMAQLINENKIRKDLIEIRFFGSNEEWLEDEVKKYGLEEVVSLYGFIHRRTAIEKQRESQLLVLLLWNDKSEEGVYTGKVFEYLGARRPILAMGWSGGVVKKLLKETGSGKYASTSSELASYISRYYQEFIGEGEVKYSGNENIKKYSYRNIARQYADILARIVLFK